MFRDPQLSWSALAAFARSMAQMMEAGVDIRKSLKTASRQSTDPRIRETVDDVVKAIGGGATLTEAFERQSDRFPPLFRDLVNVGEQTGSAPEVFGALSKYYESRLLQVRQFRSAVAWPVFNISAAVGVIGLLIFILGILPASEGFDPASLLGLGIKGASGAAIWFGGWLMAAAALYVGWKFVSRNIAGQMLLHPLLMRIPVLGKCMTSFAISRFSWCFALSQGAGMSIRPSLQSSLKATANGAFITAEPHIWHELDEGETFADALASSGLFPPEYLHFVETAEQTGTIPEQLQRMSKIFEEEAQRAMSRLTIIISTAVWFCVAAMIVFFIFRIFLTYVGMINDTVNSIN